MNFVLQPGTGSSHLPPPAYSQLKRGRTRDAFKFNPALAPSLPPIDNIDTLLQVFTHPSIRRDGKSAMQTDDYADNERLSFIGKLALETVATDIMFKQRPMLKAQQMKDKQEEIFSDETYDDWVSHYQLLQKLRCDPERRSSFSINTSEETRAIFHAYVGGVYADSGADTVYQWVLQLLGQYLSGSGGAPPEPMVVNEMSPQPNRTQTPPPMKKVKAEPMSTGSPQPAIFFGSQPPPSPMRHPLPHLQQQAPLMGVPRLNPLAPAQPNLPFLPLFNQTAAQRRVSVEYTAQFAGPSHAGTWVVRCIVNGIPKGEGKGSSKQTAKEEAARQAFYAMGWT